MSDKAFHLESGLSKPNSPEYVSFLEVQPYISKTLANYFENGIVVQHTRKIYIMYGNLNGQLNHLG